MRKHQLLQPLAAVSFFSTAWGVCSAQPTLVKIFTAKFNIGAAIDVGQGPYGYRTVAPIVGGTFDGPGINGSIASLGADWGLTDKAGRFMADIRMQLQTDDGAPIYMAVTGVLQEGNNLHSHVRFETGSETYSWLNYVIAVGYSTLDRPPPPPLSSTFDVYKVASPREVIHGDLDK